MSPSHTVGSEHPPSWRHSCGVSAVSIPHGGLRTAGTCLLYVSGDFVAIPHGGLRTLPWGGSVKVKASLVTIPHCGLGTSRPSVPPEFGNFWSPSHAVGLEQKKLYTFVSLFLNFRMSPSHTVGLEQTT